MTTSISKELMDRLVCAKYIFIKSCEVLDRGGYFAAGLAVLGFQDAVEMFLRIIAESLHANIKESTAFNQIIVEIDKKSPSITISHSTALNQLNKARVNFKHFGLQPKKRGCYKI